MNECGNVECGFLRGERTLQDGDSPSYLSVCVCVCWFDATTVTTFLNCEDVLPTSKCCLRVKTG